MKTALWMKARAVAILAVATLAVSAAVPLTVAVAWAAESPLTITTFAGPVESPGTIDGTGSAARFFEPSGVAIDAGGNIYVADKRNNAIRKITPAGVVTTLAGWGSVTSSGSADGTGSAARFNGPCGVALDTSGNVYVADTYNHTIRKVTPTGVVTTLAGHALSPGSADGTGSAARFDRPLGVAVDTGGNVYVADTYNHTIRKVTPAGVVTTLAGSAGISGSADGTGSAARFQYPCYVAVDPSGNILLSDLLNYTIRKVTPAGVVTTVAGLAGSSGSADGTGSAARFNQPQGIAVDASGNAYVIDTGSHTIRKVTPAGVVTTLAGSAGSSGSADGTGSAARFCSPVGAAVDSGSNVYVGDRHNATIRKVTSAGVVTTVAGSPGGFGSTDGTGGTARFLDPKGVATDAGNNVYVADTTNHTIRKITPAGVVTTLAGLAGSSGSADGTGDAARFSYPSGVAVDASGNVYVADKDNHTIRKITPAGVATTLAGSAGNSGSADGTGSAARFYSPQGVAVDTGGNVYVSDTGNHTIRKVTPAGVVTTLAGSAGSSGSVDGTGSAARFYQPVGSAVDAAGNVYVGDRANGTIRKITPAGVVSTMAGLAGSSGSADGTGDAARFSYPSGVAVDAAGNVYVADEFNSTIRKVTPTGVVTTLAGLARNWGSADGTGSAAQFYFPYGIALDANGNVYLADSGNNVIRKGASGILDIAIIDQATGAVGAQRQLDTAPQTATSWQWEVVRRPTGSTAAFSSATTRNPTFAPDVADLFVFRLVATDALSKFSISTVSLTATNNVAPVAVAEVDSPGDTVEVGTVVTLSGSGSYDPDASPNGGALTYSWVQTAGPAVTLAPLDDIHPEFTPTLVGTYTFKLTVNDGADDSTDASSPNNTVTVTVTPATLPTISLTPTSLSPSCTQGSNASSQNFKVSNSGGGTLNYTITDDVGWLACSPASGDATTEEDTITVAYSTSGLAVGTYTATITISDGGASNNPQTISVSLTVSAAAGGGGGGGGGCALAAGGGSAGGAMGWALPYLAMAGAWIAGRFRRRRKMSA